MGDIGREHEIVRFEPIPDTEPVPIEAPVEAPAEPVEVPA